MNKEKYKPDCEKYCPNLEEHGICGIAQRGVCEDPKGPVVGHGETNKVRVR